MDIAEVFAASWNVGVVAAAGCGKTNLIASAAAKHNTGRELILTHTYAGVSALRGRLRQMDVRPSAVKVDTIAGWSLKYALAYPRISGLGTFQPCESSDWDAVYRAAVRMLKVELMKKVVRASYTGLYVDEYQDCLESQHQIIVGLADLLPTRIVGDPLQSIFGFGQNRLVNWDEEVTKSFKIIDELREPWRWQKTNPELGAWVIGLRKRLMSGQGVDLTNLPRSVSWIDSKDSKGQATAWGALARRRDESVCAIYESERQCCYFARRSGATYKHIETAECMDLLDWATRFEESKGINRALAVRDFGSECCTVIKSDLKDLELLLTGRKAMRGTTRLKAVEMLSAVMREDSVLPMFGAIEGLAHLDGVKVFRPELLQDMQRAIREFSTGRHGTLREAAWCVRERTRRNGRRWAGKVVGRTLLVKGLEFDHCIVFGADKMDMENLYVALTRGSKTTTIVSGSRQFRPEKR